MEEFLEVIGVWIVIFGIAGVSSAQAAEPAVKLHYLGHASFMLQFDNGLAVLTDYGKSKAYGLNSPIYELGAFQPDLVIYSHKHEDHYRPVTFEHAQILEAAESFNQNGLEITALPVTENTAGDNHAHVFRYKGLTIVHTGDVQGDMTKLSNPDVQQRLKDSFPRNIDLMLAPIGFTRNILGPAQAFLDLLQPQRMIPMHYWSPGDKERFLEQLEASTGSDGRQYMFQRLEHATYTLYTTEAVTPITVISLEPQPFE